MLAAFDVRGATHFQSRHGPPIACLANKLPIEEGDNVDGFVKTNPKLTSAGPRELPTVTPNAEIFRMTQSRRTPE
jgi:hypothetical protein